MDFSEKLGRKTRYYTNFSHSNITPVGVAVLFHEIVYLANIIALF